MKTDCFAYYENPRGGIDCRALDVLDCGKCSFYKTKEQVAEGKKKAEERHKKVGWMKGGKL